MRRGRNQYIFASEDRKHERRKNIRRTLLVVMLLLAAAVFVLNYTMSNRVVLDDLRLTVLNLPVDLENYSILHLSDLHGAMYGSHQQVIGNALGDARYSCVVMTGDMLGKDGDAGPLLELVKLMPPETPKYYIPGDTDGPAVETGAHGSLSVYTSWALELQEAGVTILDRPVCETRGKGRIWFLPEQLYSLDLDGMQTVYQRQLNELQERAASLSPDDAARTRYLEYELERIDAIREMKKDFQPKDIQIALTHMPLTEDYTADMVTWGDKENVFSLRYASLILAGHYNSGQWRIPFAGAVYVPELGWFPQDRLIMGLDFLRGIPQYISPGLGSDPHYEHQPGRLFNSPRMTRIFLTRKAT